MKKIIIILLSLPKTLYCNFHLFGFKTAVKLPLLVDYRVALGKLKRGSIVIDAKARPFLVRIGWGGTTSRPYHRHGFLSVGRRGGKLIFHGKCVFAKGVSIIVDSGIMQVGDGFFCNMNCCFSCHSALTIGNDVMFGWNIECLDSDNHLITDINAVTDETVDKIGNSEPIVIGDHVWVAAYCHLVKGARVMRPPFFFAGCQTMSDL